MTGLVSDAVAFFLLAFPALFSIINPIGGAVIFLSATRHLPHPARNAIARRVALYSFVMLTVSMLIGAYVLQVFGISMPVLRVAGGIVVALSGWKLLNADDAVSEREAALEEAAERDDAQMAFYPLTMPLTTGPGTIAVAIALGTGSREDAGPVLFAIQALATTVLMALLIYVLYASSGRLSRAVGATGTAIIARLSAFLLFCIGIQVLWGGLAELIRELAAAS